MAYRDPGYQNYIEKEEFFPLFFNLKRPALFVINAIISVRSFYRIVHV